MTRRTFVCTSAMALGLMPIAQATVVAQSGLISPNPKPAWLLALIRLNDDQLSALSPSQISDSAQRAYGGMTDRDDIPNPQSTADFIRRSACALASPESRFYQSTELLGKIGLAIRFLLTVQHTDGTIDLPATNFHSTPDTGFIVKRLTTAYSLLNQAGMPMLETVLTPLKSFLVKAGEALIIGGIHTPNHRWVISAALTKLNSLWPDTRYVTRIDQWLAEQIDMELMASIMSTAP